MMDVIIGYVFGVVVGVLLALVILSTTESPVMCDEVTKYDDGAVVCEIFLREDIAERVIENGATKEDRI